MTKLARSLARNTAAAAISSGVPSLPSGVAAPIILRRCSPAGEDASSPFKPGVSIEPGLIALTRMRRGFKSVVQVPANERATALVAA